MRALLLLSALFLSCNVLADRLLLDEQWQPSEVPGEAIYYQKQLATEQEGVWPVALFYVETDKPVFKGTVNGPNLAESAIVGDFEFYHPNGQLSRKGRSDAQGRYQGTHLYYWEDGTRSGEYQYLNGRLHGEQKRYHTNGQLRDLQHYANGVESGLAQSYFDNGQLQTRVTYGAKGMEGLYESFHSNGQPEQTVNMVAGKREGERLYWTKEGWLFTKEFYLKGKLHGEVLVYHAADVPREIKHYQHDKQVGIQQRFDQQGRLVEQQVYDKEGREIQNTAYDNAGNVSTQTDTQYLAKGRVTTQKRFDATGALTYQYQSDTVKDWSLLQRFTATGELIGREEQLKGEMHGAYRKDNALDGEFVTGQYHFGTKVGKWVTKYADMTRNEQFNQQGQFNEQIEIAADGTVMYQVFYKNDKLHGAYLQRDFDKQIQAKGQYVNGQREGKWLVNESSYNQVKLWHGQYQAGLEAGQWQAFSANGHLLGQKQYDNKGQLQDKSYSFNEDGSLERSEEYVDNQLHGKLVYYFNGEVSSEYHYQNGVRVGQ
ncbi:hypothetical protein V4D05_17900 [Vibrio mimicus]|uniref:toxin-antitoxin system YwqK family antitoxin n=1 Tax=Vibrio mimicus TaxID=674 RepID=UPI002F921E44